MGKTNTTWITATDNIQKALTGMLDCIERGFNAWIEVRDNTDPDVAYPITVPNPALDNPFNWKSTYGTFRTKKVTENYLNDTERDLAENWICAFGTKEAIEKYQTSGEITKDLLMSGGIAHPVRIKDANEHRKLFVGDGYQYNLWKYAWAPKDGIPYRIPKAFDDKNPGEPLKVFVVCYDDTPLNKTSKIDALRRAENFLHDYISVLETHEMAQEQPDLFSDEDRNYE